ncbi:MAG TPA: HEAT repeat domain-containing protein [Polyangiaceae bacterium]|nr:HEAT repeat domain-containing protein [Polyangiaceae bacterium]
MPRAPLVAFASLVTLLVGTAWAAPGLADNAKLLRESKDFRVRTQAALALGASDDTRAVQPLCGGLDDENRTVRIASATALGRLLRGGKDCLQARLAKEQDEAVRTSIGRAIEQVSAPPEPRLDAKSKFYVALDKLSGPADWNSPARRAMVGAAPAGVAFAPAGESPADAAKLLARFTNARGFALALKVGEPEYSGGQLTMKVSVVVMSYPDKNIVASFSQKGGVGGVSGPSPSVERELLTDLAQAAMRKFVALAPTLE